MLQPNWKFVNVGRISPSPGWAMRIHSHAYHEMVILTRGTLHLRDLKGNLTKAHAGDILIYPSGFQHQETADPQSSVDHFYIGFTGSNKQALSSIRDTNGRIRTLARWMWESRNPLLPNDGGLHQSLLTAIAEEYKRLQTSTTPEQEFVCSIRSYILEHLTRPISLDDLARVANLSKFHFLRRYKQISGTSPMADVRSIRLEEAQRLIATTTLPLKIIAPMAGFTNEYQLSAAFTKYRGNSPKHYRAWR